MRRTQNPESIIEAHVFLALPGSPAGFSWTRSRKLPRMPAAKLTLDSPNLSRRQPASDHFRKPHQRGFELADIGGIFVVSVLVTDGFGVEVSTDFVVEPSAGVFSARLTGQR